MNKNVGRLFPAFYIALIEIFSCKHPSMILLLGTCLFLALVSPNPTQAEHYIPSSPKHFSLSFYVSIA
jgi:hypothetical protein